MKHKNSMIVALLVVAILSSLMILPNNTITGNVVDSKIICKNISLSYQDTRNQPFQEALICFNNNGTINNITILNQKEVTTSTLPKHHPRNRIIN